MSKYNFPETFITDRFILEAVTPFHAEEAYEVIDRCRGYLSEWLPWLSDDYTQDNTESFYEIQQQNFEDEDAFHFMIIDKESDAVIGSIGIDIKDNFAGAIGYWLDQDQQGKGIIAECIQTLIEFSLEEANLIRLDIYTELENIKSQKVAEKAGFVFEGMRYSQMVDMRSDIIDAVRYTLLADKTKMQKLKELEPKLKEVYSFK